jgi:hypothetical protein
MSVLPCTLAMRFRDLPAKLPSRSSSLDKSRTPTPESSDDDTAPSSVQSAWTFEKFAVGLDDADPFIAALVDVLVKVRDILSEVEAWAAMLTLVDQCLAVTIGGHQSHAK